MKRKMSTGIRPEYAGMTVLDFLSDRFTYYPESKWADLIRNGKIRVNNVICVPGKCLKTGDLVAFENDIVNEPPVKTDYSVLFEDENLLAINKPGNLPCHPAGRYFTHTLWHLLKEDTGLDYLSFVNRIDRETSGIVLVSKNARASKHCGEQFRDGTVFKRYMVIVEGTFPKEKIRTGGYLCNDEVSPVRKKRKFFQKNTDADIPSNAETCATAFNLVRRYNNMSLVEAIPKTGRLHQIRATLYSLGYPVVGDKIYGVDDKMFLRFIEDRLSEKNRKQLRLSRQALHAAALGINHPVSGKEMLWHAPMPEDMKTVFSEI
ncbi:MAG: RluA family pseudouridine synthase [Desulfobacterales bacterium]|nr:RluA family pseudouridine synthase [Desulfobacterales bacterium]